MRNQRRSNYSGAGKKRSTVLGVLLIILLLALLAAGIAWLWQGAQERRLAKKAEEIAPTVPSTQMVEDSSATADKPSKDTPAPAEKIEEEKDPEETPDNDPDDNPGDTPEDEVEVENTSFTPRPEYPYSLAQNPNPVGPDYFQDALFLGDSISTGIPLYLRAVLGDVMINADGDWQNKPALVAETGISPRNALTKEDFDLNGSKVTMLDKAASFGPRSKIYLLIGGNTLGYELTPFIEGYRELLGAVKEQYPDAVIYVQSITPVTDHATERYPSLGTGDINAKINEYNLAIMNLAQELGVHYLDIASVFVDEQGKLPIEASPSDGVHFGADYYYKWYNYLINHTAE